MKKSVTVIFSGIIFIAFIVYFVGGGLEAQATKELDKIENQVALDAVNQYKIVKRNGSAIEIHTQASLVAAAFLQANDEDNYKK